MDFGGQCRFCLMSTEYIYFLFVFRFFLHVATFYFLFLFFKFGIRKWYTVALPNALALEIVLIINNLLGIVCGGLS